MENENSACAAPQPATDKKFTVKVMWGAFSADGARTWCHNPNVALSRDEQYRQNVANGYLSPAPAADMDLARRIGMHLACNTVLDAVTASKLAVDIVQMLPLAAPPAPSAAPLYVQGHAGHVFTGEDLALLKALAQDKASDGANWSMDVGCMFVLAMIERIESFASAPPAGYIARADLVKLGNCRAELWAAPPAGDAVPVFLGAPPAPAAEPQFEEDPLDIVRTLLCTVDHYWSLPEEKRECYPSPTSEFSPLMQAARRACVERGFTAGGLAIESVGAPT